MLKHRQNTYFYIFSRATLNETLTAKYDGVLPKTPEKPPRSPFSPPHPAPHPPPPFLLGSAPPPPPSPGVLARKELLKTYERCFVCLRKDHINRNCSAKFKCHNCRGGHHVSICQANLSPLQPTNPETPVPTPGPQQQCLTA